MKQRTEFYGGIPGAWLPFLLYIIGMLVSTITRSGGVGRMILVTFMGLVLGFILAKDKKTFGDMALKGIQNPMFGVTVLAFTFAGLLGQVLRLSGLIEALIWVVSITKLNAGFIPLIAFLVSVLISTSTGTSSGTVAAVAPVLVPLAVNLGISPGLICASVISGAAFGDNVAPISDTTIGSALTQESSIGEVVRTRLPYALIAAGVSAILFVVAGLASKPSGVMQIDVGGSTLWSLALLIIPVLVVIMMRYGWDLVSTLITCNVVAIVLNLVLGCIPADLMFSNDGPIVAGMGGMMMVILYVLLLFQVLQFLNVSGALDEMSEKLAKISKSPRSAELVVYITATVGSAITGGSTPAIVTFGPLVRRITKVFHIDRRRVANILDGSAVGATCLLPYSNQVIIALGVTAGIEGIDPRFSFLDIAPYSFHCWALLIIFLASILTGIGRKFEEPAE